MTPDEIKAERHIEKQKLMDLVAQKEDARKLAQAERAIEECNMRKALEDDPDAFSNIKLPVYKYDDDECRFDEDNIPNPAIFKPVGFND